MANTKLLLPVLTLLPLLLASAGCATNLPPIAPPFVQPPQRPPLPAEGRQPNPPSICSPTCSAGVERLFESWGSLLTLPAPLASPANATPTRPSDDDSAGEI